MKTNHNHNNNPEDPWLRAKMEEFDILRKPWTRGKKAVWGLVLAALVIALAVKCGRVA